MIVDAINVTWPWLCVCTVYLLLLIKVLSSYIWVICGGGGAALLCKCMIVQVSLVSSELPSITAREQGSHPVNVSLISQSEGFSMGLFIPRGSKSVMKSPLRRCCKPHALERKCQLMGSDAVSSWGAGGGGGLKHWLEAGGRKREWERIRVGP